MTSIEWTLLEFYNLFKSGILPHGGGYYDQSAIYWDVIREFSKLESEEK